MPFLPSLPLPIIPYEMKNENWKLPWKIGLTAACLLPLGVGWLGREDRGGGDRGGLEAIFHHFGGDDGGWELFDSGLPLPAYLACHAMPSLHARTHWEEERGHLKAEKEKHLSHLIKSSMNKNSRQTT